MENQEEKFYRIVNDAQILDHAENSPVGTQLQNRTYCSGSEFEDKFLELGVSIVPNDIGGTIYTITDKSVPDTPAYIAERSYIKLYVDGLTEYPQLEQDFAECLLEMFELFKRKQNDYGPNNIAALGEKGIFVRTWDKINRLKQLVWNNQEQAVKDESVEDTWRDISVYAVMALLVKNGKWPGSEQHTKKHIESIKSIMHGVVDTEVSV